MAGASGEQRLSRRALLGGALGAGLTAAGCCHQADAAAATSEVPSAAMSGTAGAMPMPRVFTRAEWGAARPKRMAKVLARVPDHIVVHHTATPNTSDYSLARAFALSRRVQRYHMRHNKWDDCGQQLTISRGGIVMEGRNQSLAAVQMRRLVVGAQTLHHNEHTLGIESEGFYTRDPVPSPLWSALVRTCAWLCAVYGLDPATAIVGHRDYNATSCPGNLLYTQLPALRQTVAIALSA